MNDEDREQYHQAMKFFFANGDYPNGPEQTAEEALKDIASGVALAPTEPTTDPAGIFGLGGLPGTGGPDPELQPATPPPAAEAPAAAQLPPDWMQTASDERDHAAALAADVGYLPSAVQPMAKALQSRGVDPALHLDLLQETAHIVAALTVGVPIPDLAARAEAVNKAAAALGFTDPIFG